MKKIIFLAIFIFSTAVLILMIPGDNKIGLISPNPSSAPNPPKQYQLGPATDLKKELESINPQVLDTDFQ